MKQISDAQYATLCRIARELQALVEEPVEDALVPSEIDLVRLVLSAHRGAYARFHCEEGRKVIESHDMAIGYAAIELAKALKGKP